MDKEIKSSIESESEGRCPIFEYRKDENGKDIHNFDLVKEENNENCWDIDRQKILFSTAFWRLQNKTQIYIATLGDHYTDRMNHTLIVNEIARIITKRLELNESLTEAISLGHDLGHTPFGHMGEKTLNLILKKYNETGFAHNIQGARVAIYLEYDKLWKYNWVGMGLTWEVVSGIILHTKKDEEGRKFLSNLNIKITPESRAVFHADEIAQRVLDIDDALRARLIKIKDVKDLWFDHFNENLSDNFKSKLIHKYIDDIIDNNLLYSDNFLDMKELDCKLVDLIKCKIHESDMVKTMNKNGSHIIKELFEYYIDDINWEKLSETIKENVDFFELSKARVLANYIASMSDSYAKMEYYRLFV